MSRDFSVPQVSSYAGTAHHTDVPDYGPAPGKAADKKGAGRAGAPGHNLNVRMLASFLQLYQATLGNRSGL
jgi:hypothetical protein